VPKTSILLGLAAALMLSAAPVATVPAEDKIATDLDAARAAFTKQIQDTQNALSITVQSEIEKAAKTGSLDAVKELQKDKASLEANFDADPKSPRLRPAITKYRRESKAARDKMRLSLSTAITQYTKQVKLAEAEAVDAELKAFEKTGKVAYGSSGVVRERGELLRGLIIRHYARLPSQKDNDGFVEPAGLGKPTSDPAVVESLANWKYDGEKNAMADGLIYIEQPGEYEFRTYNHYDRNALLIDGKIVCPYRGSVSGGSEPAGKEKITLRKGLFRITSVGYVDAKGSVDVTWKPPGKTDFTPIPNEVLLHEPAAAGK